MAKALVTHQHTPGSQLVLRTSSGGYSMEAAVALLRWLEQQEDCAIARNESCRATWT